MTHEEQIEVLEAENEELRKLADQLSDTIKTLSQMADDAMDMAGDAIKELQKLRDLAS